MVHNLSLYCWLPYTGATRPWGLAMQYNSFISNRHRASSTPAIEREHWLTKNSCVQIARAFFAVALLHLNSLVYATTILGMDIDTVAADAEFIFEGEVIQRETRMEQSSGLISTYVTFAVIDVIKGDFSGDSLELKFMGGAYNGQIVEVSGLVIPGDGEQGIYFVETLNIDMVNPLLGWSQGHYLIVNDNGVRRINTVDHRPVIDVQPVSSIPQAIKKPQALIEGNADVAAGVMTEQSSLQIDRALTVDEFKSRITALLGN